MAETMLGPNKSPIANPQAHLAYPRYQTSGAVPGQALGSSVPQDAGSTSPQTIALGVVTYNQTAVQCRRWLQAVQLAERKFHKLFPTVRATLRLHLIENGVPLWSQVALPALRDQTLPMAVETSPINVGFATAMNRLLASAFQDSNVRAFLCLNPDGMLHAKTLAEFFTAAERWPQALLEGRQFPEEHPKWYDPYTGETAWASGACLWIPRSLYMLIGGFDPNFFLYMEDVDFSWRARLAGFKIHVVPKALFAHEVLNRPRHSPTRKWMLLSARYLAHKWGQPAFRQSVEDLLLDEHHFDSRLRLPELPTCDPSFARASQHDLRVPIADFQHQFTFTHARW